VNKAVLTNISTFIGFLRKIVVITSVVKYNNAAKDVEVLAKNVTAFYTYLKLCHRRLEVTTKTLRAQKL
jgi:hypothetical protein